LCADGEKGVIQLKHLCMEKEGVGKWGKSGPLRRRKRDEKNTRRREDRTKVSMPSNTHHGHFLGEENKRIVQKLERFGTKKNKQLRRG